MGVPTVVAGYPFYAGKGFGMEPTDRECLLRASSPIPRTCAPMTAEEVERARRCAYYFFFRRMLILPDIVERRSHRRYRGSEISAISGRADTPGWTRSAAGSFGDAVRDRGRGVARVDPQRGGRLTGSPVRSDEAARPSSQSAQDTWRSRSVRITDRSRHRRSRLHRLRWSPAICSRAATRSSSPTRCSSAASRCSTSCRTRAFTFSQDRHHRRRRSSRRSSPSTASTPSSTSPRSSAIRPARRSPSWPSARSGRARGASSSSASGTACERFVFASTCSNYGKMEGQDDRSTRTRRCARSACTRSSRSGSSSYLLERSTPVDFTILRFATVYGLSLRPRFDLTINEFARDALLKGELEIYGPQFWRPYCHVRDIAARGRPGARDRPRDWSPARPSTSAPTTRTTRSR